MQNKITTFILYFFVSLSVYATEYVYKPLVEPGKVWSEYHSHKHSGCDTELLIDENYYIQYKLSEEDTLYNGRHYYKLYQFVDCEWNVPKKERLIGGLREEEQKVYLIGFPAGDKIVRTEFFADEPWEYSNQLDAEIILYDFSLQKDDTFIWGIDGNSIIKNVDTISIAQSERRMIDFGGDDKCIEGIGCERGLFSLFALITTSDCCDIRHYLLSMQLPDGNKYRILDYDVPKDCLMNGSGTKQIQTDRLSYTIVSDRESVTVNFTENIPERIELVNMNGTVLVSRETGGASRITLPITDYPSGTYLVLFRKGAETKVGKFVKP